jgi:sugar lactone lactonase YvrE
MKKSDRKHFPSDRAAETALFGQSLWSVMAVYVSDYADKRVRGILTSGTITTFAGDGLHDESADNTQAIEVGNPRQMAFDAAGNLYISCGPGNFVRRITPIGIVKTMAGGGPANVLGDRGLATGADLLFPTGVAVDAAGNIYFAEPKADRIRRVDTQGVITTIAGTGTPGYNGDGGPAKWAQLDTPYQIALDNNGNLYIADYGNNRIREITPDGTITTVAGNGVRGGLGDGGAATDAQLSSPTGIAVDAAGNLYIAGSAKIRMVDAATGIITTIAGTGAVGFSGDGPATQAQLSGPLSLALDGSGNICFTDLG